MNDPNFLIIGTMRGGTTSLFSNLRQHSRIVLPSTKEMHYYDDKFHLGPRWYRKQFPSGRKITTGEATPRYLFHEQVPPRIAADYPNIRLIVLLRDPVERAISHYLMIKHSRRGIEPLSFSQALDAEPARLAKDDYSSKMYSYYSRGLYAEQIKRYLSHFDRDQLYIVKSGTFFRNPSMVTSQVHEFLGLKVEPLAHATHHNRTISRVTTSQSTINRLRSMYKQPNEELFELLGRRWNW